MCAFIYLLAYLFVCLFAYLFICLFIHFFILLPIYLIHSNCMFNHDRPFRHVLCLGLSAVCLRAQVPHSEFGKFLKRKGPAFATSFGPVRTRDQNGPK